MLRKVIRLFGTVVNTMHRWTDKHLFIIMLFTFRTIFGEPILPDPGITHNELAEKVCDT